MINVNVSDAGIPVKLIEGKRVEAQDLLTSLWNGAYDDTGWIGFPNEVTESDLSVIEMNASNIRESSDVLLVLGVGGSYMGAKAITDLISRDGKTEIMFLGFDLRGRHFADAFDSLEGRDYSVCVVSKSGGTMEPMAAFSIVMEELVNRYGTEEAAARTYVITEDKASALHDYAEKIGCHIIHMPKDIGGRYSIFTAVGLLPLAVHGVDVRAFIDGAKAMANIDVFDGSMLDYAICRNIFGSGYVDSSERDVAPKTIEAFEVFDPYMEYFAHWLQQLFGESEGKDGKGVFPAVLLFNRDLHSMGQFLQEGTPSFFETMILVGKQGLDREIPETDILPELSHVKLSDISSFVERGVIEAHRKAGIPLITISIDEINARSIGELMYFFMVQCAVSALLLGVNPFNQPGVEAYKSEVRKLLTEGVGARKTMSQ